MRGELVFSYPSLMWDDFSVYKESIEDSFSFYHVGMEGNIYYDSLQSAIDYLKEIKNAYYQSVQYNMNDNENCTDEVKYRSYDIEIIEDENGIMVFLSAPTLYSEQAVHEWLSGVINQLEIIEIKV